MDNPYVVVLKTVMGDGEIIEAAGEHDTAGMARVAADAWVRVTTSLDPKAHSTYQRETASWRLYNGKGESRLVLVMRRDQAPGVYHHRQPATRLVISDQTGQTYVIRASAGGRAGGVGWTASVDHLNGLTPVQGDGQFSEPELALADAYLRLAEVIIETRVQAKAAEAASLLTEALARAKAADHD